MSTHWYCAAEGRQYGPMSFSELQSKLQTADLANTFVWCDQYEDWKCAADIPALSPQPRRSPPPLPGSAQRQADIAPAPKKNHTSAWKTFGRYLLTIGSGLIGAALARSLGPVFWTPGLLIFLTWLALEKCRITRAIVPMLAILIGHTAWMLVGFSLLYAIKGVTDEALYFSLDVVVVAGLSIWTIARQSIPSTVGILLYQLVVLGNMAIGGDELHVGPVAMAMHAVLRVLGILGAIYAIVAIIRLKRQKATATS
jgi:GYF domain 2